jgi:hypothetical protein
MLKRMCGDNPEALDALDTLDEAVRGLHGGDRKSPEARINVDIVNVDPSTHRPTGNAADTALRRLRDQAPALHSRVLAGDLSPHAAMVEAGFRKRTITIKADPVGHP